MWQPPQCLSRRYRFLTNDVPDLIAKRLTAILIHDRRERGHERRPIHVLHGPVEVHVADGVGQGTYNLNLGGA